MRLAVFGAGEMGTTHANAYARIGGKESVEIAGIVSRTATRARRLAKQVHAPWFTNPQKLLRDESIDAIDVTVPSGLHRKFVASALASGKHVFCETPMAITLRDADTMIDAARANRRILMVALVMRFVADYQQVHDEVASGTLGKPRIVVARRLGRPYWSAKRPRPFRVYGEPIVEFSIHDFGVANWILGPPRSVLAHGVSGSSGFTEQALVAVEYRGGTAYIEGSAMMPPGFPFTTALRVQCDGGVFDHVTQFAGGPIPKTRTIRYTDRGLEKVPIRGHDPYEEECRHFVRTVLRQADSKVLSPDAERDALRIALAARESIRKGREVDVPN
jgi:UDP-N-acetylglucosamine 3-dehydrogenase